MGLTAPVAAVLSAAIPAVFSMYREGLPGSIPMLGFVLAAIGLWLITRTEAGKLRPTASDSAVLAGIGFASFSSVRVRQAGDASPLWIASLTAPAALICYRSDRPVCWGSSATSLQPACAGDC